MLREELKQLPTGPRELRKFGLVVGAVFLLLGAWFLWRGKSYHPCFFAPGGLLVGFGLVFPKALKQAYLGWMALAFVLGAIVSTIILTVFFYLVVTPIGLAARALGKDFLQRKLAPQAPTYWQPRDRSTTRSTSDYEQQF